MDQDIDPSGIDEGEPAAIDVERAFEPFQLNCEGRSVVRVDLAGDSHDRATADIADREDGAHRPDLLVPVQNAEPALSPRNDLCSGTPSGSTRTAVRPGAWRVARTGVDDRAGLGGPRGADRAR